MIKLKKLNKLRSLKSLEPKLRLKYAKRLIALLLAFPLFFIIFNIYKTNQLKNVRAFGDLTVDLGVPSGDPIFVLDDFKPGDCEERLVTITNSSDSLSLVYTRSENEQNIGNLSDVLYFSIYDTSLNYYYGENNSKTLTDFFNDSAHPGIPLFTLEGGEFMTIIFKVCFEITSGNEYQNTSTVFDIVFSEEGMPIDLPKECWHLTGIITEVVEGTEGNDNIHATTANELILLYGGDDILDASSGSDCIVAGPGNDYIEEGSGNGVVLAGPGNDYVRTGTGNDTVYGGEGDDEIDTGSGEDVIYGGPGHDLIDSGSGDDTVYGNEGDDSIDSGSGDDTVYGGAGNDDIRGGSDNDRLYGEAGNDNIRGGSGDDILDGGPDQDILNGNSGTDTCLNGETISSCEL